MAKLVTIPIYDVVDVFFRLPSKFFSTRFFTISFSTIRYEIGAQPSPSNVRQTDKISAAAVSNFMLRKYR